MEVVPATIDQLNLDLENPRFTGFSSPREALAAIVADQGPKLAELAADIVREGMSPAHQMLAIPGNGSSYIVVDGNRRIAALKILANPTFVDSVEGISAALKKRFKELAASFRSDSVEPLSVALLDTRDEANRWIELIHTGENKGRGVVHWDGLATDRFRGRSPAFQILELLRKSGAISEEDAASFPITNLGRLLGTPEVRAAFGVSIEQGIPKLLYPVKEVLPLLAHVAGELVSGNTPVSQLFHKEDRIAFSQKIPRRLLPKKRSALADPMPVDVAISGLSGAKNHDKPRKPRIHTALRRTLVPTRCKLHITDVRLQAILGELRRLHLDKNPNAIAVLLRVFLELSMDAYAKRDRLKEYDADRMTLSQKVLRIADQLQGAGMRKNDLASFRRAAQSPSSPLHVDRLHKFVHNAHALPTSVELRAGWDEVQHVFEEMWKQS